MDRADRSASGLNRRNVSTALVDGPGGVSTYLVLDHGVAIREQRDAESVVAVHQAALDEFAVVSAVAQDSGAAVVERVAVDHAAASADHDSAGVRVGRRGLLPVSTR